MDKSLFDMALKDIKEASKPDQPTGAEMAGFLLGFCFIDAVAGFHAGRTGNEGIGEHFREFVRGYMKAYDPHALYNDLRSGLVHSYAIGQKYAFTDLEKEGKHLETTHTEQFGQRTLLNLEDFLRDLEGAYRTLCGDICTDPKQFAKARERYDSKGLLSC